MDQFRNYFSGRQGRQQFVVVPKLPLDVVGSDLDDLLDQVYGSARDQFLQDLLAFLFELL